MSDDLDATLAQRLEGFRGYLTVLARASMSAFWERRFDDLDVVQATLIQAQRATEKNLSEFTDAELAVWLRKALVGNLERLKRDHQRLRRDLKREVSMEQFAEQSSLRLEGVLKNQGTSPSSQARRAERVRMLSEELVRLPQKQCEAIELIVILGYSRREAAQALSRSELAIAGLVRRGLAKLEERLRGRLDGEV